MMPDGNSLRRNMQYGIASIPALICECTRIYKQYSRKHFMKGLVSMPIKNCVCLYFFSSLW